MSKLSIVRKSLEEKAVIAHIEEENIPPNICMCWPHRIDFYIAPQQAIYKAGELNLFLDTLIPDIEPSYKTYFRQEKDALITGILCFDEKIGGLRTKQERFIAITDRDIIKKREWADGKFLIGSIEHRDYLRRISIRPYPNAEIIEQILHNHKPRWKIEIGLIREYHDDRKWWQKLLNNLCHEH